MRFRCPVLPKYTQAPHSTKAGVMLDKAQQTQTHRAYGHRSACWPAPASATTAGGQPPPACLFLRTLSFPLLATSGQMSVAAEQTAWQQKDGGHQGESKRKESGYMVSVTQGRRVHGKEPGTQGTGSGHLCKFCSPELQPTLLTPLIKYIYIYNLYHKL